ncbi:MAG: AhpC/TSA family protein, partial [Acidobacteria bacterium]|nr:AhpC/TSA family protein [Acidobacteriota bacterium]
MNLAEITSLNDQIQEMAKGINLPEDAARVIMEGMAQVKMEAPCQGLPIGQKAPDFQLKNQHNDVISLRETLAAGPVVLKFIRGAWCPFCNLDVKALQQILPQLEELSATLLVINPQKPDKSQVLQSNHSLGFDILSDEDQQVIRAYQLQFTVPSQVQEVYKNFGFNLPELTADG